MPKILTKLLLKQPKSESGFTLMEVLVASLMVFIFVVGSMQALALSVAIRIKAQERQRADQLIQEDIEAVRFAAENLPENISLCSANGHTGSYAESLKTNIAYPDDNPPTKLLFKDKQNGKKYRLDRFIKPPATDEKQPDLPASTNSVLKIKYEVRESVTPDDSDPVIATDYIEVIPNAATQCP